MAKIALTIEDFGPQAAKCKMLISRTFALPLSAIVHSFENGLPVAEQELFARDFSDFPRDLLAALEQLGALGCQWRAFEVLGGETWNATDVFYEVTVDRLRTIVEARAASIEQQRNITFLESDLD